MQESQIWKFDPTDPKSSQTFVQEWGTVGLSHLECGCVISSSRRGPKTPPLFVFQNLGSQQLKPRMWRQRCCPLWDEEQRIDENRMFVQQLWWWTSEPTDVCWLHMTSLSVTSRRRAFSPRVPVFDGYHRCWTLQMIHLICQTVAGVAFRGLPLTFLPEPASMRDSQADFKTLLVLASQANGFGFGASGLAVCRKPNSAADVTPVNLQESPRNRVDSSVSACFHRATFLCPDGEIAKEWLTQTWRSDEVVSEEVWSKKWTLGAHVWDPQVLQHVWKPGYGKAL